MEDSRVVEGYYKCPVPFAVRVAALEVDYPTVIGGHDVAVTLPTLRDDATVHRDELGEPPRHYLEHDNMLSRRAELAPFWGRIVQWTPDFDTATAVSVQRFGITANVQGDDDRVSEAARQIADAAPVWWAKVSSWIEVRFGQDLSQLGPVEPGVHSTGTTLWTRLYSWHGHPFHKGEILPVGSTAHSLVWPNYAPITTKQLQRCLRDAQDYGEPAAEWLLIRDANSLCAGQDFRRAVLDVGLAAELAVTQLITAHLRGTGETDDAISRVLRRHPGLGGRCGYWVRDCDGTLPSDYRSRLVERRNTATHEGERLSENDVRDAIAVATAIVSQVTPIGT